MSRPAKERAANTISAQTKRHAMLRALCFQPVFYLYLIVSAVICSVLILLPRRFLAMAGKIWVKGLFVLMRLLGVRCRIEGLEAAQQQIRAHEILLIASNHQSLWETLVIPFVLPEAVMVVKRELLWIPFFGWCLYKLGAIGLDRSAGPKALRHLLRQARGWRGKNRALVIFPEGTRAAPDEILPYQPGIAALYHDLKVPCLPAALNSGAFWPRRKMALYSGEIILRFLEPLPAGLARRPFMEALETRIREETAALPSP